jgi:hypothetical protein
MLRDVSTTHNTGENVQNNVVNIENLYQGSDDEVDPDFQEIRNQLAAIAARPPESFGHKLFRWTCIFVMWTSMLIILSIVGFLVYAVYLAYVKAHGG